jgi:RNA polymerase sigma-70 factor (ECF subfamily)
VTPDSLAAHWDAAFRHVWRICGNRQDAEDAVQDGYVRLLERLQAGYAPEDDNPRGLVCGFARRRAWHLVRHKRVQQAHDIIDTFAAAECDDYSDPYDVERVRVILQGMAPERVAVLAGYAAGYTAGEMAEAEGRALKAIKSRLYKALDKVRRDL